MTRFFPAFLALIALALPSAAQEVENVFLITLDGLRWEELFTGADAWLLDNEDYTSGVEELRSNYWSDDPAERRAALMPFFWSTIAKQGSLYGNRLKGSRVNVTNKRGFSYPGYNEILTGRADPAIKSNDKKWNANITFLEVLNGLPDFENRILAFGSWDVFPYIINSKRSGLPVNAGFSTESEALSDRTR